MRLKLRYACWLGVFSLLTICANVQAEFTAIAGWERQLFPSYIIATSSVRPSGTAPEGALGDPRGLLGVQVVAPRDNVPVKVTIQCDEIAQLSEFSGTLPKKGESYRICPKVKFRYQELAKIDQSSSVSVTYRVKVGDSPEEEQTINLLVRSINDCPFAVAAGDETIDTSFTFAAYVNEQHPFVDKLLREALDIGMVDKFTGYQSGKRDDVVLQAYALWDLLVSRDVRYSSITTSAVKSESVASQHVRLIEDTVNNSQANCVDGSVLLVSMLRKIGIDAFLVIEPGHCYAGFFGDANKKTCYAIETTLLGEEVDSDKLKIWKELDEAIDEEERDEDTFASFAAAIQMGTGRFVKNAEHFKDENQPKYRVIDIEAARQQGILPIAFNGKQDFVAFDHSERFNSEATDEDEDEEEDE